MGGGGDFETFVAAAGPRLLRVAWLLPGDARLAEDLLRTALAKVWPKWRRLAGEHPEAYVRKVLVTTHTSWWRRHWRGEVPHGELPERPGPFDAYENVDPEQFLAVAVRALPTRKPGTGSRWNSASRPEATRGVSTRRGGSSRRRAAPGSRGRLPVRQGPGV
ncbi:SigE family RNA polymerase sigma factor [Streptomyces sp. NPDC017988]|uniref:SigE family RNA polymerase sigma factor n=1 Tax=Streptomyces sp. NPDC017988 TaxID=3365025 RepID=UPI0037AFAE59